MSTEPSSSPLALCLEMTSLVLRIHRAECQLPCEPVRDSAQVSAKGEKSAVGPCKHVAEEMMGRDWAGFTHVHPGQ